MGDNEKYEDVLPDDGSAPATGAESTELQKLKQERDNLYDRLLRKQAEFDNYRKRVERDRAEFAQTASADLMRELLNAMDSFDLAIRNTAAERSSNPNMLQGLDLIYKQFQDVLGRFGLKAIEAKGESFDPNIHQAVSTTVADDVEENTVVEELRKGYTLNGRLLRPSMVTVAVHSQRGTGD